MKDSLEKRCEAFARKAHDSINHQRKYTGEPYTVHLQAVADLVRKVSGSPEMIGAAWLHDVVEDTPVTLPEVQREFGDEVATLVGELTDVSRPEDGNRKVRKAIDREHLAVASPEAKTIKLADLIDNSYSIQEHSPGFAKIYMQEKRLLLEVLQEGDPDLHAIASEIVARYFGELK